MSTKQLFLVNRDDDSVDEARFVSADTPAGAAILYARNDTFMGQQTIIVEKVPTPALDACIHAGEDRYEFVVKVDITAEEIEEEVNTDAPEPRSAKDRFPAR